MSDTNQREINDIRSFDCNKSLRENVEAASLTRALSILRVVLFCIKCERKKMALTSLNLK